ncbi:hypothetical protein ACJ73_10183 [Blastomyces percursus]|uniref:Uncharacterized protein n=1 Tax=Blastomyces percursus TaxID=1658174 RepID=A0A1J9P1B3_9EURO|nr:hypothetical protein ACJ73_10183 [Blastomyces percursus]
MFKEQYGEPAVLDVKKILAADDQSSSNIERNEKANVEPKRHTLAKKFTLVSAKPGTHMNYFTWFTSNLLVGFIPEIQLEWYLDQAMFVLAYRQLEQQTEKVMNYIKHRPTNRALGQLVKGCQMAMHSAVLL